MEVKLLPTVIPALRQSFGLFDHDLLLAVVKRAPGRTDPGRTRGG